MQKKCHVEWFLVFPKLELMILISSSQSENEGVTATAPILSKSLAPISEEGGRLALFNFSFNEAS